MDWDWTVSQLLSYSPGAWLTFLLVAASAAYWGRWLGIVIGHLLLAFVILYLDVRYQSAHANKMDLDLDFSVGVAARIVLVNTVLLPVSAVAFYLTSRIHEFAKT